MTVYADVLIVLNLYVTFFILNLTCRICKDATRFFRLFLASLFGGFSSLYIFLPTLGFVTDCLYRLFVSSGVILIALGFGSLRGFLRRIGIFFIASFLYAGAMMGLWAVLNTKAIAIKGGVVYMDISPTFLIISTLICYLIISLIRFLNKRQAYKGKRVSLSISLGDKTVKTTALVDTGHSLLDPITERPIIIIESSVAMELLGFLPAEGDASKIPGYRVIPYSAVGGHGLLNAFKPSDIQALISSEKNITVSALVAISNEPLGEDYRAIISPETLEN